MSESTRNLGGRPRGTTKTVLLRNRAIKFLEQTLKDDDASDLARVAAANKLIDLNPTR